MNFQDTPKIRVVIRKRPLNKKEESKNDIDIIHVISKNQLIVKEEKVKVDLTKYVEETNFTFDSAFDETADNQKIYLDVVRPLVDAAFSRAKVTCFAYGQTGSGKTYTMMGVNDQENYPKVPGLYLLAAQDIFNMLQTPNFQNFSINITFFEIYCGKLFDLLNDRQQLQVREDAKQNVNIVGIQETKVSNIQNLMQLINYGMSVRVTNVTGANDDSSRSHAILQINIKGMDSKPYGKISFIDLAGSERAADVTDQNKQTRIDGAEINKSLLALKECIRALDMDKNHTPFRGSKLTLVLRDSFIGNCRTVMIGQISPASSASENTLNTLRYADRVKELKKQNKLAQQQITLPRQIKNMNDDIQNQNYLQNIVSKNQRFSKPVNNIQNLYQNNSIQLQQKVPLQFNININSPNMYEQNQKNNIDNFQTQQRNSQNLFDNQPQPLQQNKQFFQKEDGLNFFNSKRSSAQSTHTASESNIHRQSCDSQYQQSNQIFNQQYSSQNQYQQQPVQNDFQQQQQVSFLKQFNKKSQPQDFRNSEMHLKEIQEQHKICIDQILQEEENLIQTHRSNIDENVQLTHDELQILHDVDQPGSNMEQYLNKLNDILDHKHAIIQSLRSNVNSFKQTLKKEEDLSLLFYQKKNNQIQLQDMDEEFN